MHSRVFQLENNPRNLEKSTSVTVDDLPNADYVDDSETPERDIEWLIEMLDSIPSLKTGENDHGKYIIFGSKKDEYFRKKYDAFINAARRCTDIRFDDFARDTWLESITELHMAYSNEFGIFIHSFDIGIVTLDHFIRMAKPRRRYYIGAIGDYHW